MDGGKSGTQSLSLLLAHGDPPPAVAADWSAQLIAWTRSQGRSGRSLAAFDVRHLKVDPANQLVLPATTPNAEGSIAITGDAAFDESRSLRESNEELQALQRIRECLKEWRRMGSSDDEGLNRAWRHLQRAGEQLTAGSEPVIKVLPPVPAEILNPSVFQSPWDTPSESNEEPSNSVVADTVLETDGSSASPSARSKDTDMRRSRRRLGVIAIAGLLLITLTAVVWWSGEPESRVDRKVATTEEKSSTLPPIADEDPLSIAAPASGDDIDLVVASPMPEVTNAPAIAPAVVAQPSTDFSALMAPPQADSKDPITEPVAVEPSDPSTSMEPDEEPNEGEEDEPSIGAVLPPRGDYETRELASITLPRVPRFVLRFPDWQAQEIERHPDASDHWLVCDDKSKEPLAEIVRRDGSLDWRWCPASQKSNWTGRLPNARLECTDGSRAGAGAEKPLIIWLRGQESNEAWRPDLESGEHEESWPLGTAPDRRTIVSIECAVPEGVEFEGDAEATTLYRKGMREWTFHATDQEQVAVRVRWEWSGGRKFELRVRTDLRLDPQAVWLPASVEQWDQRSAQMETARLASQQQLTAIREQAAVVRFEPQRSQLREQRLYHEGMLKQIELVSERMVAARALLHSLHTSARWQVVLETPWHEPTQVGEAASNDRESNQRLLSLGDLNAEDVRAADNETVETEPQEPAQRK